MRYFLAIGAAKAGTSWLHAQLIRHPQVHLPAWKELHYFDIRRPPFPDANFAGWYVAAARRALEVGQRRRAERLLELLHLPYADTDGRAYREYLSRDAGPEMRVVGEATPAYATLDEEGFRLVHEVLAAPRLIMLLRDPLERLWSHVRMRQPDRPAEAFAGGVDTPMVWARCDYPGTMERLERVFPPELVHVEFYEHLFTPDALNRLAAFLGVDPDWPWDLHERVRAGRPLEMPAPAPELVARLMPIYAWAHDRFGDRLPETWRK